MAALTPDVPIPSPYLAELTPLDTFMPLAAGERSERQYRRRSGPAPDQSAAVPMDEDRAERRARKKRAKDGRKDKRSHKRRRRSSADR